MSDGAKRLIKRYANRKYYDTSASKYVTRDEIADLVISGIDITIIDNKTKADLTKTILTQVLLERQKKKKQLPLETLKHLLQQPVDFWQNQIVDPLTLLRDETVQKVFRPKQSKSDDATKSDEQLEPPEITTDHDKESSSKAIDAVQKWLNSTQQSYESLQKGAEDRWNDVLLKLGQFDINHRRIVELEKKVTRLEQRIKELEARQ